jgi:hypothetical protein
MRKAGIGSSSLFSIYGSSAKGSQHNRPQASPLTKKQSSHNNYLSIKAPINLQGRGHPAKQAQKKSKSPKKLSLTELLEKTVQGSLKNVPMGASDIHNKGEVKPKSSFLIVRRATLPPTGPPLGGKRSSLKQKASAKPSLRTKRVQNTALKKVVS